MRLGSIFFVYGLLPIFAFAQPKGYTCTDRIVTVPVSVQAPVLNVSAPGSDMEVAGLLVNFANMSASVQAGTFLLEKEFQISTTLCVPACGTSDIVEIGVHGIGADSSYWTFGGKGSPNNYAEKALERGRAFFMYDRLGTGKASRPDTIQEVQITTNVEIAAYLVNYLRCGVDGKKYNKVVAVGHSNGSLQLLNLVVKYANIVDGMVLTGFTPYTGNLAATLAAMGFVTASSGDSNRFGPFSSSYLLNDGTYGYQMVFFSYPNFDLTTLQSAYQARSPVTVGELLTQTGAPAPNYTNPLLIVTGNPDFIFCPNGCFEPAEDFENTVESTKMLFPNVTRFTTYIPPNTGHAVNLHLNAQETFDRMADWIDQVVY